jgi:hypothetical protein
MGLLRDLFGPSKDEIWSQLAREINAQFVEGGFWGKKSVVRAKHKQWTLTLDTYTVSTGKSTITYTRMRAPYVNPDGFHFTLYRAGFFTELGKMLGMQDIEIGHPEFDRNFVCKGNHPPQVIRMLGNPILRELIQKQPEIYFHVQDDEGWFGTTFPEGVDELRFQVVGVIKDIERLKALYLLFAETLNTLCHIGSAYEDDPKLHF